MNTNLKYILKASLVISFSGLLMGNKSCQKTPPPEPRELKKIVDIGQISSQPVTLPNGNVFDFQFVVNQQIYNVLYESKAFAFRYASPVVGLTMANDGSVIGRLNMSKTSRDFFEKTMNKSATEMVVPSKIAYCLMNKPQARLSGAVTSFELLGGGGLHLGFTPTGASNAAGVGASFDVKVYQLAVILNALSPIKKSVLASVSQRNNKTDTAGSFNIMIGPFSAGPSYYYNTPMAKVTRATLEGAVNSLKNELKKEEWFTRVLDYEEGEAQGGLVALIGGTNVGMQIGDQLAIYNEITYWQDEPCNSEITHEGGALGQPVAIVQITDVSPEISSGHVTQTLQDFNPAFIPGAKVKVHKLKSNDAPGISGAKK